MMMMMMMMMVSFINFFQIWRALRFIVDTGLHYKGMKRDEAIKMFQDYLWDNTDLPDKEVRVG